MLDEYRLPVTEQGVVLPKVWFGAAKEVVVRTKDGELTLAPIPTPEAEEASSSSEPASAPLSIWDLGSDPILDDPVADSSTNLDHYLYGKNQ